MWLAFAALAILSLWCPLSYIFTSYLTLLPITPCVTAKVSLSSVCGEPAWIQVCAGNLQNWGLSESEAELTTTAFLFQKPKGRPTFAELLRVLSEIAETWWLEWNANPEDHVTKLSQKEMLCGSLMVNIFLQSCCLLETLARSQASQTFYKI